jgi:hypothetical protein
LHYQKKLPLEFFLYQIIWSWFLALPDKIRLKGQCHEIFCLWFFSWISFPQASDYTSRAVSNFFENSQRYLQLKVWHRCQRHLWQMEKTFKQKNFNNFVWTPLGSRVNIYINFCLQVHFKVSATWYCCHHLPPVSLVSAAILLPVSLTPVANFPPVSLIPVVHLDLRISPHISGNFQKNSKRSKWNTLGLGGNWFMKKTRSKKSRDTVPLSWFSSKPWTDYPDIAIDNPHVLPFPDQIDLILFENETNSELPERWESVCIFVII